MTEPYARVGSIRLDKPTIGALIVGVCGTTGVLVGTLMGWPSTDVARVVTTTVAAIVALTGHRPGSPASAIAMVAGAETLFR